MRRIRFEVRGELPPKKDGAKSMWSTQLEAQRLIALREAAHQALDGAPRFAKGIRLTLYVHVGNDQRRVQNNRKQEGDLDNYISGVCDGLMAAHANALPHLHESFRQQEQEVHPSKCIAYMDDSAVARIVAEKHVGPGPSWYRVEIKGD